MTVTIVATATYTYVTEPASPIGFEATFEVYDTTAGGGAGETFVTVISIDPTNAVYWTQLALTSTGIKNNDGTYTRHPAHAYDPAGITATWTERISDNSAAPTRYVCRGRFGVQGGLIQISAESTQLTDPTNSASLAGTNTTTVLVPIPAPSGF